jgi:hypothetical protein
MNGIPVLGVVMSIALMTTFGAITPILQQEAEAARGDEEVIVEAPPAISGENVYVTWWTNKTANNNEEIMFRASTDGGATFGDKINLSNTTDADSWRAEIAGEGPNVLVSWWETNQTADTPVARISSDSGQTFGPMLMLATNGTIGEAETEQEAEEEE